MRARPGAGYLQGHRHIHGLAGGDEGARVLAPLRLIEIGRKPPQLSSVKNG